MPRSDATCAICQSPTTRFSSVPTTSQWWRGDAKAAISMAASSVPDRSGWSIRSHAWLNAEAAKILCQVVASSVFGIDCTTHLSGF